MAKRAKAGERKTTLVRIYTDQLEGFRVMKKETGVPIVILLDRAIDHWFEDGTPNAEGAEETPQPGS